MYRTHPERSCHFWFLPSVYDIFFPYLTLGFALGQKFEIRQTNAGNCCTTSPLWAANAAKAIMWRCSHKSEHGGWFMTSWLAFMSCTYGKIKSKPTSQDLQYWYPFGPRIFSEYMYFIFLVLVLLLLWFCYPTLLWWPFWHHDCWLMPTYAICLLTCSWLRWFVCWLRL